MTEKDGSAHRLVSAAVGRRLWMKIYRLRVPVIVVGRIPFVTAGGVAGTVPQFTVIAMFPIEPIAIFGAVTRVSREEFGGTKNPRSDL